MRKDLHTCMHVLLNEMQPLSPSLSLFLVKCTTAIHKISRQISFYCLRDESLIPSWGAGYIQGGSEIFFVMYWGGVENKRPIGRGGGHVFRQVLGD